MPTQYRVALPKWLDDWWWRVAYLRPAPGDAFRKFVDIAPNEQFKTVVQGYLTGYLDKGVTPPADIAPAIMNMADDVLSGREVTLKTGDYVALQMHVQNLHTR